MLTRVRTPALALILALSAGGCFSYRTAELEGLARGSVVRAELSRPIDVRLLEVTAHEVSEARGEVVGWDEEFLILSVTGLRSAGGRQWVGVGETVRLRRDQLSGLEERRVSGLRTGLVVAGGVTALLVTGAAVLGGTGPDAPAPPPAPPPGQ